MYRCEVCGHCSQLREPRIVYVIERLVPSIYRNHQPRKEIEREIPICRECATMLKEVLSLEEVCEVMQQKRMKERQMVESSGEKVKDKKRTQRWVQQAVPFSGSK